MRIQDVNDFFEFPIIRTESERNQMHMSLGKQVAAVATCVGLTIITGGIYLAANVAIRIYREYKEDEKNNPSKEPSRTNNFATTVLNTKKEEKGADVSIALPKQKFLNQPTPELINNATWKNLYYGSWQSYSNNYDKIQNSFNDSKEIDKIKPQILECQKSVSKLLDNKFFDVDEKSDEVDVNSFVKSLQKELESAITNNNFTEVYDKLNQINYFINHIVNQHNPVV